MSLPAVIEQDTTYVPGTFEQAVDEGLSNADKLAEYLADNELLPKQFCEKKSNLVVVALAARELGIGPITALNNFHIVNGQLGMKADMMVFLARKAGHLVRREESCPSGEIKDLVATTIVVRKEDRARHVELEDEFDRLVAELAPDELNGRSAEDIVNDPGKMPPRMYATYRSMRRLEERVSWSKEEAQRAQLLNSDPKSNWNKYRRAMLHHRADSECIRRACGEVLGAYQYTPEELGASVDEQGAPTQNIVVQRVGSQPRGVEQVTNPTPGDIPNSSVVGGGVASSSEAKVEKIEELPDEATAQDIYNKAVSMEDARQVFELAVEADKRGLMTKPVRKIDGQNRVLRSALSELHNRLKK